MNFIAKNIYLIYDIIILVSVAFWLYFKIHQ